MRFRRTPLPEIFQRHGFNDPELARLAKLAEMVGAKMMPAWVQVDWNASKANQNIPNTTETTVATVTVSNPSAQAILLVGVIVVTLGAASTSETVRIRADSLTGAAQNNPQAQGVTTALINTYAAVAVTGAGEVASRTFVLTSQKAGGAAADTVNEAALVAFTI